jgi:acetyl esterase
VITTDLFSEEAIDPETKTFLAQFRVMNEGAPSVLNTPLNELREARERGTAAAPMVRLPSGSDEIVPGPAGGLMLRCFVPDDAYGAYLHFHGGGFVMGGPSQQDPLLDRFARERGLAVISVGYRLAPEHPFPAALDDSYAAALWLIYQAAERFGNGPLFIGGESAGAYLAVQVLLRLRNKGLTNLFRAALLNFGIFDLGLSPSARNWGDRTAIISTPILRNYVGSFVPDDQDPQSAQVSPLYADLTDMPPALFTVGTLDPLLDDSLLMSQRWLAAENSAELAVYPGGMHGFTMFPIPIAEQALARQLDFLQRWQAVSP